MKVSTKGSIEGQITNCINDGVKNKKTIHGRIPLAVPNLTVVAKLRR